MCGEAFVSYFVGVFVRVCVCACVRVLVLCVLAGCNEV